MRVRYVDLAESELTGNPVGWGVFDELGNYIAGPFDTEEEAEEWVQLNFPTPSPT